MPEADQATKTQLQEEYEAAREKAAVCREKWQELLRRNGSGSPEEQAAKEAMSTAYGVMLAAYRQLKKWRYL